MTIIGKRSIITLYSNSNDLNSHRIRLVLAEKGILTNVIEVDRYGFDKKILAAINPEQTIPTLVDRDLVLSNSRIIMEYLDERFPHPSLLPVYPVDRAKFRLMIDRIETDWYSHAKNIFQQNTNDKHITQSRQKLTNDLLEIVPFFKEHAFCFGEEFSLIDCSLAPILWRLPMLGLNLIKRKFKPLLDYAEKIFERPAFQSSLTEAEQELHNQT